MVDIEFWTLILRDQGFFGIQAYRLKKQKRF